MAGKTTDMVKEVLAKRARRTAEAPPWLPMLLPAGMLLLAAVLLIGIYSGSSSDLQDVPGEASPSSTTTTLQGPVILPDPGLPDAYYVALTAALSFVNTGDPGLATTSGLPLTPLPPVLTSTISYDGDDAISDDATRYLFSVKDEQGSVYNFSFSVYYDGTRWLIND